MQRRACHLPPQDAVSEPSSSSDSCDFAGPDYSSDSEARSCSGSASIASNPLPSGTRQSEALKDERHAATDENPSPGELRRNANGHVLCRHNARLYRCANCCGGGGICPHSRRRYRCLECRREVQHGDGHVTASNATAITGISRRTAACIMTDLLDGQLLLQSPGMQPSLHSQPSRLSLRSPRSADLTRLRRDGTSHILCPHNVRMYRCVPCGGTGICEHNRRRYYCLPCGGGGICSHSRRRDKCLDCKRDRCVAGRGGEPEHDGGAAASSWPQHHAAPSQPAPAAVCEAGALPGSFPRVPEVQASDTQSSPAFLPPPLPAVAAHALHRPPSPSIASSAHVAAASCTGIETMLRNWSQCLLAPSYAQPAAASLRASVNTPCEVGHKRRGPYAKTTERALLKIESRLLVAATSLPVQCLTSNAQNLVVEGDAIVHSKGCNCKHSHCLKRYCECHAAGARCTPRCKCLSCGNG